MREVMTIGYEGLKPVEFYSILNRCGVEALVDVRQMPLSRKPGFSKKALEKECGIQGLAYFHLVKLGCPPEIRNAYRESGDWQKYTRGYQGHLDSQHLAMQELAGLVVSRRCCLLCFEQDYNFCHRTFVAIKLGDLLQDPLTISHLTGPISGRVVRLPGLLAA